jgi:hypothetical protein
MASGDALRAQPEGVTGALDPLSPEVRITASTPKSEQPDGSWDA